MKHIFSFFLLPLITLKYSYHAVHYIHRTYLSYLFLTFTHMALSSPLPALPLTTTNLFSVSMCSGIFFFFHIPHTHKILEYLSFSLWLISFSMSSRSIHIAANGKISFFIWLNSIPWVCVCVCVCILCPSSLCIHSLLAANPYSSRW